MEAEMQKNKLYVGNLNYDTTESELQDYFSEYGEVQSVKIIGRKGFGFVEMATEEEAQAVIDELNQKEFGGRNLRIDYAKPRRDDR